MTVPFRSGQTGRIIAIIFGALVFMFLVGFLLYRFQVSRGQQEQKNENVAENTNAPAPVQVDITALPVVPADWKTYAHPDLQYTVKHPADWSVEEVTIPVHTVLKNRVTYVDISNPGRKYVLRLGVRQVGEPYAISERTGKVEGDIQKWEVFEVGHVSTASSKLVEEGKTKTIFYYPVNPLGYVYLDGHEVQAEFTTGEGAVREYQNIDLSNDVETQVANTMLTSLKMPTGTSTPVAPDPSVPALGKYRIDSFTHQGSNEPDTRLRRLDGKLSAIVFESTRTAAQLPSKHGLIELAFPAFGTTIYLQDVLLDAVAPKGTIWSYTPGTNTLTAKSDYPPIGWGKIFFNTDRTKGVYTSSTSAADNGDIKTLYLFDFIKNTVTTLLTLSGNQTFSSGWGGPINAFSISWKDETTIKYSTFNQESGNKQKDIKKDKITDGEVTIP